MFGEKYNDAAVRVVEVPGASMELCGGTHVERTAQVAPCSLPSNLAIHMYWDASGMCVLSGPASELCPATLSKVGLGVSSWSYSSVVLTAMLAPQIWIGAQQH